MYSNIFSGQNLNFIPNFVEKFDPDDAIVYNVDDVWVVKKPDEIDELDLMRSSVSFHIENSGSYQLSPFSFNWNQHKDIYSVMKVFKEHSNSVSLSSCHVLDSEYNTVQLINGSKIKFGALKAGDQIQDSFGTITEVLKTKINGIKEAVRYTTHSGNIFECTPDHLFQTVLNDSYVELPIAKIFEKGLPLISRDINTIIPETNEGGEPLIYPTDLEYGEQLKHIKGFEGLYAISSNGRVWAFNKHTVNRKTSEIWLAQSETSDAYKCITLGLSGEKKTIHRMVAEHFVPNGRSFGEVHHLDFDRTNNNKENLEWCTRTYNKTQTNRDNKINFGDTINHELTDNEFIISATPIGLKEVGDIQVKSGTALYLMNGITVHNCRIDAIARDPHLAKLIELFGSTNITVAVEGISERVCNFLQKSLLDKELYAGMWRIINDSSFNSIKLYYIYTGLETQEDIDHFDRFISTIDSYRKKAGKPNLQIRSSFTPLLSTVGTPLQYHGAMVSKSLTINNELIHNIKQICSRFNIGFRLSTSIASSEMSQMLEFTDRRSQPWLEHANLCGISNFNKLTSVLYKGEQQLEDVSREAFEKLPDEERHFVVK